MAMYTDQELITAFSQRTNKEKYGLKCWTVTYTPIRNTSMQRIGDTTMRFWAQDKAEAKRIATEYGLRIKEYRVRYIYLVRGI